MARKEARIFVEIWDHDRFKDLSFGAQWLYMVKLSQADLSFCGVQTTAVSWWASLAKDATAKAVDRWLTELHDADFVVHDANAAQVLIIGFIRRDGVLDRANLIVAMSRAYAEVRSVAIRQRIITELEDIYPDGVIESLAVAWNKPNAKTGALPVPIEDRMNQRMVDDIRNAFANGIRNAIQDGIGVHSA